MTSPTKHSIPKTTGQPSTPEAKVKNGYGSKKNVPPVNIPITTKIGSKLGGEFTYPKMGSQNDVDPRPKSNEPHIDAEAVDPAHAQLVALHHFQRPVHRPVHHRLLARRLRRPGGLWCKGRGSWGGGGFPHASRRNTKGTGKSHQKNPGLGGPRIF